MYILISHLRLFHLNSDASINNYNLVSLYDSWFSSPSIINLSHINGQIDSITDLTNHHIAYR
uniref:Uncharacterized protein n=1 Tax=Arion vulgaris TaxID=1028688 RepID=A0A0B6ZXW8_9EUPU